MKPPQQAAGLWLEQPGCKDEGNRKGKDCNGSRDRDQGLQVIGDMLNPRPSTAGRKGV